MDAAGAVVRTVVRGVVLAPVVLLVIVAAGVVSGQLRTMTLVSGSMGESMPAGTIVLQRPVVGEDVTVGDVLTYRPPGFDKPVTHRVVAVDRQDGYVLTKGDANDAVDDWRVPLDGGQLWAVRGHLPGLARTVGLAPGWLWYLAAPAPPALLVAAVWVGLRERRSQGELPTACPAEVLVASR